MGDEARHVRSKSLYSVGKSTHPASEGPNAPTSGAAAQAASACRPRRGSVRPEHMDTLGAALVVTGVAIATCSLVALAALALVALVPWSRFRPRYQRGVSPDERLACQSAPVRWLREMGDSVHRHVVGRRTVSRHPRGARHLLPLWR